MGNKFNKIIKFLIGTFVMFISIAIFSFAVDSPLLFCTDFIIAPTLVYFFVKKLNMKSKKYYLGLLGIFIAAFISVGVSATSNPKTTDNNKNNEIGTQVGDNIVENNNEEVKDEGTDVKVVEKNVGTNTNTNTNKETIEAKVHFINTGNSVLY